MIDGEVSHKTKFKKGDASIPFFFELRLPMIIRNRVLGFVGRCVGVPETTGENS